MVRGVATLRKTPHVKVLLETLLEAPETERYTLDLATVTRMSTDTVSNILRRLTERGWLERREEKGDPAQLRRPLRVYYSFVPDKAEEARAWLATFRPLVFVPLDSP